jgi:hypothetical protein
MLIVKYDLKWMNQRVMFIYVVKSCSYLICSKMYECVHNKLPVIVEGYLVIPFIF